MFPFMCFVLLVSLEGLKAKNTAAAPSTNGSEQEISSSTQTNKNETTPMTTAISTSTATVKSASVTLCTTNSEKDQSTQQTNCLFNLKDSKEMLLWSIISLLLLICLLLLVILCLVCKRCRSTRHNYEVVNKSPTTARRNSVNGGPSETDIMLKGCSSVKVETETTPDESQKPEEVGGASSGTENQVPGEESKKSANDTSETGTTQEFDQSGGKDLTE